MKANELIQEVSKGPVRIRLGVGDQTAPNPFHTRGKGYTNHFSGNPDQYQFASHSQRNNYLKLKEVLRKNGLKFNHFFASTYIGGGGYANPNNKNRLETFIGIVGDINNPVFIWYKYEGYVAGGGQNYVIMGGVKGRLSNFLEYKPAIQTKLINRKPDPIVRGGPRLDKDWEVIDIWVKDRHPFGYGYGERKRIKFKVKAKTKDVAKNLAVHRLQKYYQKQTNWLTLKGFEHYSLEIDLIPDYKNMRATSFDDLHNKKEI